MTQVRGTTPTNYVTTTTVNNIPTTTCCTTSTVLNVSTSNTINYTACVPTGTTGEIIPTSTPSSINSSVATPGASGCFGTPSLCPQTQEVFKEVKKFVNNVKDGIDDVKETVNECINDFNNMLAVTVTEEVTFEDIKDFYLAKYMKTDHYEQAYDQYKRVIHNAEQTGQDVSSALQNFFSNLFSLNSNGTTNTVAYVPTKENDPTQTAYNGDLEVDGLSASFQYNNKNSTYRAQVDTQSAKVIYSNSSGGNTYGASACYNYGSGLGLSGSFSNDDMSVNVNYDFSSRYLAAGCSFYSSNVNACLDLLNDTLKLDANFTFRNGVWFKVTTNYNYRNPGASNAMIGIGINW